MIIYIFYTLNLFILFSCFTVFLSKTEKRFLSLSLIQALAFLPLLAGEYIYIFYHLKPKFITLIFFSENIFAMIWANMSYQLGKTSSQTHQHSKFFTFIYFSVLSLVLLSGAYISIHGLKTITTDDALVTTYYGMAYLYSVFLLISMFFAIWHLEGFWRSLNQAHRWQYKFLATGAYLVCGSFVWASSYRLTYMTLIADHYLLLAFLLLFAWLFINYAVLRHRLLNRKIFISRKIVYSAFAPSVFAAYLVVLGIMSLIIKTFDLSFPFVLRWIFIAFGLIAVGLFLFSGKLRRRTHFFISTHFYINKYEYRDEWLALSRKLQEAYTEKDVIYALRQVLNKSLYTTHLIIWLKDTRGNYNPYDDSENTGTRIKAKTVPDDDFLIKHLKIHPYFYIREQKPDQAENKDRGQLSKFMADHNLELIIPLFTADNIIGFIGLGPEFTGKNYGKDDFDLLAAISAQTSSALIAVQLAEKLANIRERAAWEKLSAFVLHDVKNAASMLSLVRENASDHINNPEFQNDMLESIDDALARMAKVQNRLSMLKGKLSPDLQNIELGKFLNDYCRPLAKKLEGLKIDLVSTADISAYTDPKLLYSVLENLILNALEAGDDDTVVTIEAFKDEDNMQAIIHLTDNGPGISDYLLPDALFEPFKTTKSKGTGIGLWHAKQLVTSLNGSISAKNTDNSGALFIIRLPLADISQLHKIY